MERMGTALIVATWMLGVAVALAFGSLGVEIGCSNILSELGQTPLAWCLVALIWASAACGLLGASVALYNACSSG